MKQSRGLQTEYASAELSDDAILAWAEYEMKPGEDRRLAEILTYQQG